MAPEAVPTPESSPSTGHQKPVIQVNDSVDTKKQLNSTIRSNQPSVPSNPLNTNNPNINPSNDLNAMNPLNVNNQNIPSNAIHFPQQNGK